VIDVLMEEGVVVEVRQDKVLVKPQRSERCEGCSPAFCHSDDSGELTIEAKDPIGVTVGQHIRLAIREQSLLWYSFLLYGLPVISLLTGVFAGSFIGARLGLEGGADVFALALGFGLTLISFLKVRQYVRKHDREPSYQPVVVEIVNGRGS
jgi:positive regulator of sigma E activity